MARFQPGKSGNPAGRPRKSSDGPDKIRQALLGDAPEILEALVTQAKTGDTQAAKLILDRCLPPLRPRDSAVSLDLPVDDLAQAARAILSAVAAGTVTIGEANGLAGVLATTAKAVEVSELIARIEALEEASTRGNRT